VRLTTGLCVGPSPGIAAGALYRRLVPQLGRVGAVVVGLPGSPSVEPGAIVTRQSVGRVSTVTVPGPRCTSLSQHSLGAAGCSS
jgi:hypothetical protein